MVPTERLELSQLSPPPPQDGVSTNSTTSALQLRKLLNFTLETKPNAQFFEFKLVRYFLDL